MASFQENMDKLEPGHHRGFCCSKR